MKFIELDKDHYIYKVISNNIKFEIDEACPFNMGNPFTADKDTFILTIGNTKFKYKKVDNRKLLPTYIVGGLLRDIITGYGSKWKDVDIVTEDVSTFLDRNNTPCRNGNTNNQSCSNGYSIVFKHDKYLDAPCDIWQLNESFTIDDKSTITIYSLLDSFDFNCNMIAYDILNNKVIVHEKFLEFMEYKIVIPNNVGKINNYNKLNHKLDRFNDRYTLSVEAIKLFDECKTYFEVMKIK